MKKISIIRRFAVYYKPHIKEFILDMLCACLLVFCDIFLPLFVGYLTNLAVQDITLITPRIIIIVASMYLALRIADTLGNYFMQTVGHFIGAKMETQMREDMFCHLQKLSFSYYSNTKIGQIMSRITTDLFDVTEFAHHCPEMILVAFVKIVLAFIILSSYNFFFALTIIIMIPIMVSISLLYSKKMHKAFKDQRVQLGEINSKVEDNLLGIRVVKSFANEQLEEEKFRKTNSKFLTIKKRAYYHMAGFHSLTRFFDGFMYILVVVYGIFLVSKGKMHIGDFTASLLFVSGILASIKTLVDFAEQFQRGLTSIERYFEILDIEPERDSSDCRIINNIDGRITFENVFFNYEDNKTTVLANINLDIMAGENIALVGPSGGGKTTFCSLIPRFYNVEKGKILIDGFDIKDFSLNSLRSHIGIVQQDVYLFSGSVMDNIMYGKQGATKDDVIAAARLAGAHEFIMSLPDEYDTYIGERGVKLSGGQKQRISISRVFLKNPRILILDEATSSLDNESERIIQESLETLCKGRTTITIAHRLSTIKNADRIIVLDKNGIIEQGSHNELFNKNGIYRKMLDMNN